MTDKLQLHDHGNDTEIHSNNDLIVLLLSTIKFSSNYN